MGFFVYKPVLASVFFFVSPSQFSEDYRSGWSLLNSNFPRLYLPLPSRTKLIPMMRYISAFSLEPKGSSACRINAAVLIVQIHKKAAGRVNSPSAINNPPRNSDSPAIQAKNTGNGNPIFPVFSMSPSEGGNLPSPWPNAINNPVPNRSTSSPASV